MPTDSPLVLPTSGCEASSACPQPVPTSPAEPAEPAQIAHDGVIDNLHGVAEPGVLEDLSASASDDQPSRYLDSFQAAEYLGGMNHRVITKWAREGYLPAYPLGEGKRRLWRFLRPDLDQWMQARRTGTLPAATDAPTQEKHHGW